MTEFSPGALFGEYVIERELGRGGMGVVLLAEQPSLRRRVALKVITPLLAEDEMFRRRFEHEARSAAAIDHPNVVPIYATGIEDGHLFMAMRFVDGQDLGVKLRSEGSIDPTEASDVVIQVAAALDAAHARGLVHRDVKPANILLSGSSSALHVYLGDFGLTKDSSSTSQLTNTGHWVGTLDYVAPEQIEGGVVDARTDVYAMACVIYQMLAGTPPYTGQDAQKMWSHMHHEAPSLEQHRPDLARAFDPVIDRGMAKAPDDRYPSAGDLGRAVAGAASGTDVTVAERSVAVGAAARGLRTAGPDERSRQATREIPRQETAPARREKAPAAPTDVADKRRSNRALVTAGLLAALLIGGLGTALALSGLNEESGEGTSVRTETDETEAPDSGRSGGRTRPNNGDEGQMSPTQAPPTLAPANYTAYVPSDPIYDYSAELPTGNGWSDPVESRPTGGALLRTTVRGPEGALLIIDRTPDEVPQLGGGFDSSRSVSHPEYGTATEYIISSSSSIPECSGQQCVDYLIEDGRGGGWGVLAGGPSLPLATEVASAVASSISD